MKVRAGERLAGEITQRTRTTPHQRKRLYPRAFVNPYQNGGVQSLGEFGRTETVPPGLCDGGRFTGRPLPAGESLANSPQATHPENVASGAVGGGRGKLHLSRSKPFYVLNIHNFWACHGYAMWVRNGVKTPFNASPIIMPNYLERHGRKYRVVVAVPRRLQAELGTKLKETLNTDSLEEANRLKWAAVARLKARFHTAGDQRPSREAVVAEALRYRETAHSLMGDLQDYDPFWDRAEEIRGEPVVRNPEGQDVYDEERSEAGGLFIDVALGRVTPVETLLSGWHGQTHRKERTRNDDRRAVRYLMEWCAAYGVGANVQTINRRIAGQFVGDLIRPLPFNQQRALTNKTANKYISSLSAYWTWMERRGHADDNVWIRQSLPSAHVSTEKAERPFTDEEVRTLLSGVPSHQALPALMKIAALTGARIEAIVSLKVRDTRDDVFVFKPQKRERGNRKVPIHSSLTPLIEQLTAGKGETEDLFPGWPVPPPGSGRERSMPASKAFTKYRRRVGVDDVVEGRRRSRVNFHSFRRWFATKAEQAGQLESVIAAVLGHRRPGMTFGRYSEGPSMEQLRTCVEAVRLPARGCD